MQTCLETELALAIKNAEAALTSSFDTWAHSSVKTLNDTVDASIKAIEKKVDTLNGSSYGHITKTTLPEFVCCLDALEARARPSTPPPANKIDPSNDATNKTDGVALEVMMMTALMSLHALGRPGLRLVGATVSILTRRALPQRAHPVLRTPPQLGLVAGSFGTPL